ncbi:MAG: YigZ family protein [Mariprofundus sp.]
MEQEIKRSRFISDIGHAENKANALAFIEQVKKREPDARHHCWAYIAGHPTQSIERGSSDAGEPQGTAGKPMLNVLQHKQIGEIVVVVSRYFGGIKLGAGGLVRAYSSSVQQAVEALPITQRIATTPATLQIPFEMENSIRHLLAKMAIEIKDVVYQSTVTFHVEVELEQAATFEEAITNKSHGKVNITFPRP